MAPRTKFFYFGFITILILFTLIIFFILPISLLEIFSQISIYAIFFSAFLFIILFSKWSDWWNHPAGWTLVILDLGLMLSTAPAIFHLMLGVSVTQSVFFAKYYVVSLSVAAIGIMWRTWIMIKHNIFNKIKEIKNGPDRKSKTGGFTKIPETQPR